MRRVRAKDTKPELRVRRALHRAGFRFRLHKKELPGSPDLVLPRYRMAVWVHGCFWHGHDCPKGRKRPASNVAFWEAKLTRNVERDVAAITAMRKMGWKVSIVWECSLENDLQLLIMELCESA